jgi:hypothetical protein
MFKVKRIGGKILRIEYCYRQEFFLLTAHVNSDNGWNHPPSYFLSYRPAMPPILQRPQLKMMFQVDLQVTNALCYGNKLILLFFQNTISYENSVRFHSEYVSAALYSFRGKYFSDISLDYPIKGWSVNAGVAYDESKLLAWSWLEKNKYKQEHCKRGMLFELILLDIIKHDNSTISLSHRTLVTNECSYTAFTPTAVWSNDDIIVMVSYRPAKVDLFLSKNHYRTRVNLVNDLHGIGFGKVMNWDFIHGVLLLPTGTRYVLKLLRVTLNEQGMLNITKVVGPNLNESVFSVSNTATDPYGHLLFLNNKYLNPQRKIAQYRIILRT